MKLAIILVLATCIAVSLATSHRAHLRHHKAHLHQTKNIPVGLENFITAPQKDCQKAEVQEKVEGADVSFEVFHPAALDVWAVRVSDGPVSNFYDAMDSAFESEVKTAFESAYESFRVQVAKKTESNESVTNEDGTVTSSSSSSSSSSGEKTSTISLQQLIKTAESSKWPMQKDFKKLLQTHDHNGDGALNFKEFSWFLIDLWSGADPLGSEDCQHCLKELRDDLSKFFWFVDCDGDGSVCSEDIYNALKNFNTGGVEVSSTHTNDFVLKTDDDWSAYLNVTEFTRGVLMGYWDRMIGDDGFTDDYATMKNLRAAHRVKIGADSLKPK